MKIRTLLPIACLLTACASMPFGAGKDTKAGPVRAEITAPAPAPSGLKDGIALYNNGDYNGAIRRLGQADVTSGPKATQLEALKYTAFSYCLTSRTKQCRHQFEKAFKLDPSFDLEPGEHGHPLWGPVFVKAKKAK